MYAEAADLVGYALSENYLFTREAFAAYLDHLTEGGRLALVVHNHALMLRTVATLGALWEERGHEPSAVLDHLVVVNGARGDPTRQEAHRPLLLVQQQPYTPEQLARLHAAMEELGLAPISRPEGASSLSWRRCAGLHWRTLSPHPRSTSRRQPTTGPSFMTRLAGWIPS